MPIQEHIQGRGCESFQVSFALSFMDAGNAGSSDCLAGWPPSFVTTLVHSSEQNSLQPVAAGRPMTAQQLSMRLAVLTLLI